MEWHASEELIIKTCKEYGLLRNEAAYCLATAKHETGAFRWLKEIWGPTAAQKRYEGRSDLGNNQPGDGKRYMGRGYVHITGRRNYTDWAKRLGVDIVGNPELASNADIAARVLVEGMKLGTFTGKKLSDYITLNKSDFHNARRIVNGRDKASLIAGYAAQYDELLKDDGYGIADVKPIPAPKAKPKIHKSLVESKEMIGGATALIAAISAFFEKMEGQTVAIVLAAVAVGFIANRLYARFKDER